MTLLTVVVVCNRECRVKVGHRVFKFQLTMYSIFVGVNTENLLKPGFWQSPDLLRCDLGFGIYEISEAATMFPLGRPNAITPVGKNISDD
jgi:hypothetical protein